MKIEQWKTTKPIPYARNARIITDAAVSKVAGSLKEFGWQQPIVVDADGVIIAGHTRLQAAQQLGMETVPVTVATELTDTQVKAYRLADNRSGEETSWDKDMLAVELGEFDLNMPELAELTAFDLSELEDISGMCLGEDAMNGTAEQEEKSVCPKCGAVGK